jgi:hypothetical protein
MRKITLIFALSIISLPLLAQTRMTVMLQEYDSLCPPECPPPPEHRERRMLEAVRVARMTEMLELNNQQISKFFPKLKQMEENQREVRNKHRALVDQLEKLMIRKAKDQELKAKLDSLDQLQKETLRNMEKVHHELDAMLTIQQRALWRIFDQNFDEEIRKMVVQVKEKRYRRIRQQP